MRKFLAILSVAFLTAGCSGSGGGGGSLASLFSNIAGSITGSGSGSSGLAGGGSSGSGGASPIALVHQPEPSSIALLSVGLIALAVAALRKNKKK